MFVLIIKMYRISFFNEHRQLSPVIWCGVFLLSGLSYKSRLFKFSLDTVKLVFVQISGTNFNFYVSVATDQWIVHSKSQCSC